MKQGPLTAHLANDLSSTRKQIGFGWVKSTLKVHASMYSEACTQLHPAKSRIYSPDGPANNKCDNRSLFWFDGDRKTDTPY